MKLGAGEEIRWSGLCAPLALLDEVRDLFIAHPTKGLALRKNLPHQ
jgi:hypothetical protein